MDRKEEFKKLIEIIKESTRIAGNKLSREEIAERFGVKPQYLSQLIGPRGIVTESHILLFKEKFRPELELAGIPMPGDPLNEERALVLAILDDYAERTAKAERVEKDVVVKRVESKAKLILKGLNSRK